MSGPQRDTSRSWLTYRQAQKRIGVSEATLRRMVRADLLHPHRIGSLLRTRCAPRVYLNEAELLAADRAVRLWFAAGGTWDDLHSLAAASDPPDVAGT